VCDMKRRSLVNTGYISPEIAGFTYSYVNFVLLEVYIIVLHERKTPALYKYISIFRYAVNDD